MIPTRTSEKVVSLPLVFTKNEDLNFTFADA